MSEPTSPRPSGPEADPPLPRHVPPPLAAEPVRATGPGHDPAQPYAPPPAQPFAPPPVPPSAAPFVASRAVRPLPEPLSTAEIARAALRPDLAAEQVLGSADRIAGNVATGTAIGPLLALLAGAGLVFAVPFGALSPIGMWWHVPALFTGSLLLCLPCLHVVLQFLGFRTALPRTATLAFLVPGAAAIFTLALAPIIWFIDVTTAPPIRDTAGNVVDTGDASPAGIARVLLGVALAAGMIQLFRSLYWLKNRDWEGHGVAPTVIVWIPLFLFIVWRMAGVLGLRG